MQCCLHNDGEEKDKDEHHGRGDMDDVKGNKKVYSFWYDESPWSIL